MAVADQVLAIYAVSNGFMDGVAEERIADFEAGLADYVRTRHGEMLEGIAASGQLPEGDALDAAITAFVETFEG